MPPTKRKAPVNQAPKAKAKTAPKRKPRAKPVVTKDVDKSNVVKTVPATEGFNVVWQPLPGSQSLGVTCPCNHILLEGARGGGKTDTQLMLFLRFVGIGYGQHWRGIIFDREYKNLSDMIAKSKRWFRGMNDGARFLEGTGQLKWIWPTGEELWFRTMKNEDDYYNYHGMEAPFIGHNELTKNPNLELYDMIMSINRSSFVPELHSPDKSNPLPEIPLMVVSTTNPYGPGHNAVKQRFIDVAPPGVVVPLSAEVFNPRTQRREVVTKTQVRLFSSYKENTYLAPEYVLELESIKDPNKRAAWLYGDWDITAGGMFDDVWSSEYNLVPMFEVPHNWSIYRTFDWGSSKPFSVGWWAESNGDDLVMPDGSTRSTIAGDVFRMQEWYGWNGKPNTGLRMLNNQIARGIIEREIKFGWGSRGRVSPGPADNSINDIVNGSSVANDMAKSITINGKTRQGPVFAVSNKSPGSRIQGWEKMRTAIYNAQPDEISGARESPGLFVTNACADGFLRTVPTIPRSTKNLDDVDCWVAGTQVSTPCGRRNIEDLRAGALVLTPIGACPVKRSHVSGVSGTVKVKLSDGSTLQGTHRHPVMVQGVGLVDLADLQCGMIVHSAAEDYKQCNRLKRSSTRVSRIVGTLVEGISRQARRLSERVAAHCTATFTRTSMAPYLKAGTSTTRMATSITTVRTISKLYPRQSMPSTTTPSATTLQKPATSGPSLRSVRRLYAATLPRCESACPRGNYRAQIVAHLLKLSTRRRSIAKLARLFERLKAIGQSPAQSATPSFTTSPIPQKKSGLAVRSVVGCSEKRKVYNLTVHRAGLYYANGVLSSNTDAEDHVADEARYYVLSRGTRFGSGTTLGTNR